MYIKVKIRMCLNFCLIPLLVGCSNTMYFYETEKISLTVEARPDSSQPVQGSIGIKQRVVLLAPKKDPMDAETAKTASADEIDSDGDVFSAISSFNFKTKEESGFNPTFIQTAFVTGKAASSLEPDEAARVAKEIIPNGFNISPLSKGASCILWKVNSDPDKLSMLRKIVEKDNFTELSEEEWEKLKPELKKCGVLVRINFKDGLRKAIKKEMNKQ